MSHATWKCGAVLFCGLLACLAVSAEEKGKTIPAGTWTAKAGEVKVEFCDNQVLKLYPHGDPAIIAVVCSYTLDKDKRVDAKVTELSGKAKDQVQSIVPIGSEFSFKWTVKDDVGTIGDVKGKSGDVIKSHLEGEYTQKTR